MRLAAAALVLAAARAGAEPPPCLAQLEIQPDRAVVGQAVVWRARILRRDDVAAVRWATPPRFPGFRVERLEGVPASGAVEREGRRYLPSREERVLFPARAGELVIPEAELACSLPEQVRPDPFLARVAGGMLTVEPVPKAGRPEGYTGVVGPVQIVTRVDPLTLSLGESARLWVLVAGAANTWSVPAPFGPALGDADLFADPASLEIDLSPALRVTHTFRYRLVPRATGRLRVPPVEIPYYDPARGGFGVARSREVELDVSPRRTPAETHPRTTDPETRSGRGVVLWVLAAALAGGAAWLARSRWRAPGAAERRAVRALLARAGTGEARDDALRQALRRAVRLHVPEADALTPDELRDHARGRPALAEAAGILATLERARFGDPSAPPVDPARVEAAARALLPPTAILAGEE